MKRIKLKEEEQSDFDKAVISASIDVSPFFGSIIMGLKIAFMEDFKDEEYYIQKGTHVIVNYDSFFKLTKQQRVFIFVMIATDIALFHNLEYKNEDVVMYKIASHIVCSLIVVDIHSNNLSNPWTKQKGYDPSTFQMYRDKTIKEVYNDLMVNHKKALEMYAELIKLLGQHFDVPGDASEYITMVKSAASADTEKVPNTILATISAINFTKVSWKTLLANYFNKISAEDTTFDKVNRRKLSTGDIYPGKGTELEIDSVHCYIDTSGSVSTFELEYIYNEMLRLKEAVNCTVYLQTFDTSLRDKYVLTPSDDSIKKLRGRGGTSLKCVSTDIKAQELKSRSSDGGNIYIVMSDLQCSVMPKLNVDMLWLCVNNSNAVVDFGTLIHIEV